MRYSTRIVGALVWLWAVNVGTLQAVIVAGANGGGNNSENTTQADLETSLGTTFPLFDHVVAFSDATGVYLGHDGALGYVLTAGHVINPLTNGFPDTVTIAGTTYDLGSRTGISGVDLAVYTFTPNGGAFPILDAMPIASLDPTPGELLIMHGRGRNRVENATTDPNVSDATPTSNGTGYHGTGQILRWGTNNHINAPGGTDNPGAVVSTIGGSNESLFTQFNDPGAGNYLSSNEAQATLGDSGGSIFTDNGTDDWELAGIIYSISPPPITEASFGSITIAINLPEYTDEIDAITGGALIPEPAVPAFLFFGFLALILRRNGRK